MVHAVEIQKIGRILRSPMWHLERADPCDDVSHWFFIEWVPMMDNRLHPQHDWTVIDLPTIEPPRDLGMFNCRGDYVYRDRCAHCGQPHINCVC